LACAPLIHFAVQRVDDVREAAMVVVGGNVGEKRPAFGEASVTRVPICTVSHDRGHLGAAATPYPGTGKSRRSPLI
jgi:hypothetical protein